jgi:hypothetical protein
MAPRKSDNDAERLERLKAQLVQLHADGRRAIGKSREARETAQQLRRTLRQKSTK